MQRVALAPRIVPDGVRELRKVSSLVDLVGNTPLLEIRKITRGLAPGVRIFAKLEGFNPGGSVKDRAALKMVQEGIESGKLTPGKTIMDSTSGNTGIALAMIGRVLGYPVELVLPANVSSERKGIIDALGAKVIFSDPMEGSDGAMRQCRKILEQNPGKYFKPDQYFNPMNSHAHYETTGPEIYRWRGHSLHRRHRNRRHDHGDGALPQREQRQDPRHRRRTR
jgi:cysteine synthase B